MREPSVYYFELYSFSLFRKIGGTIEEKNVLRETKVGKYYLCNFLIAGKVFKGVLYRRNDGKACITDIVEDANGGTCLEFLEICELEIGNNTELMKERILFVATRIIWWIFLLIAIGMCLYGSILCMDVIQKKYGFCNLCIGMIMIVTTIIIQKERLKIFG